MIDHTGVVVSDYQKSRTFYVSALAPLGFTLVLEFPSAVTGTVDVAGFGEAPKAEFWAKT